MLFYSPLLLVLLRVVACRCQASCGKTVKRETSKKELEKSCLILRINVSSQFSDHQATLPLVSAAPLSG